MKTVKVWDIFVRVFHWSLAVAVFSQPATAEEIQSVHVTVGYFIIALLIFRVVYGFVGTEHARFKDFVYPVYKIRDYLKGLFRGRPDHYIGHNPAGGAMVIALLIVLALTTLSGLLTYGAEGKGPLALGPVNLVDNALADDDDHGDAGDHKGYEPDKRAEKGVSEGRSHFWKEIHESVVGFLIFLICVHVAGVVVSSYVHKENLILAMITGYKKVG